MTAALRLRWRLRELYSGGRLLISILVGGATFFLAQRAIGPALAGTLGWVLGVAAFLGLTLLATSGATPERMRARSRALDPRAAVIVLLIVVAAAASLGALVLVVQRPPGGGALTMSRVGLAFLAVAASWLLAHTTIALHYAHSYYGDPDDPGETERGGLEFPGGAPPDYWDFAYFSFVVGMTCQVSDVQVTSRGMRRLTLAHGVLSFFFNTGVLALAINILAGVL